MILLTFLWDQRLSGLLFGFIFALFVAPDHCQSCYLVSSVFHQDIETFDLEDFKYNFVNMTAFRLVDSEHYRVRRVLKDMEKFQPIGHNILNQSRVIQVNRTALL